MYSSTASASVILQQGFPPLGSYPALVTKGVAILVSSTNRLHVGMKTSGCLYLPVPHPSILTHGTQ